MGINSECAAFLCDARAAGVSFGRVLTLGRLNLNAGARALRSLASRHGLGEIAAADAANEYVEPFFRVFLRAERVEAVDNSDYEGAALVHDLNASIPSAWEQQYDAVIDGGTLEHCFNIGQAARNAASMCALGGFVMHGNPVNMYNHGFYNLSPVWYHDFYKANAFDVEAALLVNGPIDAPRVANSPLEQRFVGLPDNTVQIVVARRREIRELAWPTQGKYVKNPTLRG